MKPLINILITAALVCASGCSAFRPSTQTLNINVTPPDAVVMVNGQRCTPPAQVPVRRDRELSIQAYKDGYVPYMRTIGTHMNGTGGLDAAGCALFLLPGIGLFCPGSHSLDETDIGINLYQK